MCIPAADGDAFYTGFPGVLTRVRNDENGIESRHRSFT